MLKVSIMNKTCMDRFFDIVGKLSMHTVYSGSIYPCVHAEIL